MAITTENTYLISADTTTGATWSKVIDIKEFPDLGGAPGTVDITTLSDHMKTSLPGLIDPGNLEFSANYDLNDYKALMTTYDGKERKYGIQFGKSGGDGVFTFTGILSCWVKGGGTEAAVDLGISIAPSTEIVRTDNVKVDIEDTTE